MNKSKLDTAADHLNELIDAANMKNDLQSSVKEVGDYVTQIIHFVGGEKRTFHDIESKSIRQGQFTKFKQKNGAWVMVNDKNVLCIEVFKENKENE